MTHATPIDLLEASSQFEVFRLTIGYDEVRANDEGEGDLCRYTTVRSVAMLPEKEQAMFEAVVAEAVGSTVDDSWSWDIYAPVPAKIGEVKVFIDGDLFYGEIVEVLYTPTTPRPEYSPKGDWVVKVDVRIPGKVDG